MHITCIDFEVLSKTQRVYTPIPLNKQGYDLMGRKVRTLVNGEQIIGFKNIQWNATNDNGQPVPAGMYIYTIQAGEFRQTKKMILLK